MQAAAHAHELAAVLDDLVERHPALEPLREQWLAAAEALIGTLRSGSTVFLAGNGGSAADCEHFGGEMLKSFEERAEFVPQTGDPLPPGLQGVIERGFRVVPLTSFVGARTAIENDQGGKFVFAQLLASLASPGDALVCITTSGNSENLLHAATFARAMRMRVVALTGKTGGRLAPLADVELRAPGETTAQIQELHLPIYHAFARAIERDAKHWPADG